MRIEDMTINKLKSILVKSDDRNIKTLRFRINQLYEKYFEKSNRSDIKIMHLDGTSLLKRLDLYEKHKLVKKEISSRSLYIKESSLDRAIFRKALVAVDVQDLPEIPVIRDYVSIYGDFLKSPNEMGSFSITIRDEKDKVRVEVTESVRTILEEGIKKSAEIECSEELTEDYIPLYDLMLVPKSVTKKVTIEKEKPEAKTLEKKPSKKIDKEKEELQKPFPNEHACRLRSPGGFKPESFRRTSRTSNGKKYNIVSGRLKGETTMTEQAYRYNKDTWTEATARKHCKDHDGILFEPAKKEKDKTEKEMIFKILKVNKKQQIVGGVVYEPDEVDTQGDYTDSKEIEKAMTLFMEKYAEDTKKIKVMHKGKKYYFPIIEAFQPDTDITKGGEKIKAGSWWMMVKVKDKAIWKEVEEGKLTGFSMGGVSNKEDA